MNYHEPLYKRLRQRPDATLEESIMQEYTEEIKIPNFSIPKQLTDLPEVKQLVAYINTLRPREEDYSPKNWREIVAKPTNFIGFGQLGDWYLFLLQQKNQILLKSEVLSALNRSLDKGRSKLALYMDILKVVTTASGLTPKDIDWENLVETFDYDEPRFHEKEIQLQLNIDLDDKGDVVLNIYTHTWERYYEDEDRKVGDSGKLQVVITESTVEELQPFVGFGIMEHDVTDCQYSWKTPDVPVKLNLAFFKQLSILLQKDKQELIEFLLDIVKYPFTKWDRRDSMPDKQIDLTKININSAHEHVIDEIAANVPDALEIFKVDYLERSSHIQVLDYLAILTLDKVRNEHCKFMTLLALAESPYFDFSAATDLISNHTHWHVISDRFAWYEMDIVNANNEHEFSVHYKFKVEVDQCIITTLKIIITNVANSSVRDKILHVFEPHLTILDIRGRPIGTKAENTEGKISAFYVQIFVRDLERLDDHIKGALMALMKLMHLDWSINQFWKFLYEMTNAEDDETACDGEFIPDLVMKSINDDGDCGDWSEDFIDEDVVLELEPEEVDDIVMEVVD